MIHHDTSWYPAGKSTFLTLLHWDLDRHIIQLLLWLNMLPQNHEEVSKSHISCAFLVAFGVYSFGVRTLQPRRDNASAKGTYANLRAIAGGYASACARDRFKR